ncbi:MAG: DUF5671 domain-containing protein, partial [Anaerolineaceae bacterium]|nr:DUF5671 domain-containing protein [Anaerolineaceae bacterium]
MLAVRRLYFYLVSFISLEVVIWGVISLARTAFEVIPGESAINVLASGLSLVLVGLPIFLLHWVMIQREVYRDEAEQDTRLRAVFEYAVRFATLIPVAHNIIALINRLALTLLGEEPSLAFIGAGQNLPDNLTAIAVNIIIWNYFDRVLKRDWQMMQPGNKLTELRRLYRYVWVLYSLVLTIAGVQKLLHFVLNMPVGLAGISAAMLANGLALILVAAPIWVLSWQIVQSSLDQSGESDSLLRLIVLYLVTFVGAALVVVTSISVLGAALRWVLGETQTLTRFLIRNSDVLALAIPLGVVWAYFSGQLHRQINTETEPQRKAGLKRLHDYYLVLLGNSVVFFGLWHLAAAFVQLLWNDPLGVDILWIPIGTALSALLVGLPLWVKTWPVVQRNAGQKDTSGDHARRSVIRKGYLYLVLFLTVAGAMASAGQLLFMTFMKLLEASDGEFWLEFSQRMVSLLLLLLWMGYHLRVLRRDSKLAHQTLGRLHARFPVLVFEMNGFSDILVPLL